MTQQKLDTLKSLSLAIAKEYEKDIRIEINIDSKKGIAKINIIQYNL